MSITPSIVSDSPSFIKVKYIPILVTKDGIIRGRSIISSTSFFPLNSLLASTLAAGVPIAILSTRVATATIIVVAMAL